MPFRFPTALILALVSSHCLAGAAEAEMARVAGGTFIRPLERDPLPRKVAEFHLDRRQVTNAGFLEFVTEHPQWQRSRVNSLFADDGYLRHWESDLVLGPGAPPEAPVTNVSWFAARAYLKARGKRLPSTDEWEFTARASAEERDATKTPGFKQTILTWYSRPTPKILPAVTTGASNIYGVQGMHGLVWEWTRDFNSSLATGESRADGSPDSALFCGGAGLNTNNATEYADFMRFALRSSLRGNYCLPNLGFRGARNAERAPDPEP